MKVLWVGDAACSSGFARCTHAACNALHAAGHTVDVLALNYWGDPHQYPYRLWPCVQPLDGSREVFGVERLPRMVARLDPNVVVILNDPWNVPAYLQAIDAAVSDGSTRPRVVGCLAVDAMNQDGAPLDALDAVIVWTQFALDQLRQGGFTGDASIIPLGVDSDVMSPGNKAEARRALFDGDAYSYLADAFIVGVVGRNQPRKRLDVTLAAFAEFREQAPDAWLLLHVAPTGDSGFDLKRLAHHYGVSQRTMLSAPHVSVGMSESILPRLYRAMDVYLTTSQGEGWGLPTLEAMACGIPCVVPDASALGEWTQDAALRVSCNTTAVSAPLNGLAYTVGAVPDVNATADALLSLHNDNAARLRLARAGRRLAERYTWRAFANAMVDVIESVDAPKMEAAAHG